MKTALGVSGGSTRCQSEYVEGKKPKTARCHIKGESKVLAD